MVDQDIPNYAALLREHYLFKGLDEADIAHVIDKLERRDVATGDLVIEQGDYGDGFYIIYRGQVKVTRLERQKERILDYLSDGDYFGEEALLFDRPRSATITAVEDTILLRLGRDPFFNLLQKFPQIRMNLSATAESRNIAQKEQFEWLGEDEVIYLVTRKHEFFLILSLIVPILMGIVSIPMLLFGFALESSLLATGIIALGIGAAIIAIFLLVWNYLDWGNDYYIVTNQRVAWLERVLIFYYSRQEAPLTQVLSVNVTRSWLGRIIDYGNVEVRTFTGGIKMRNMSNPRQFESFVQSFQERVQQTMEEVERVTREQLLRGRLGLEEEEQQPETPEVQPTRIIVKEKKPVKPGSLREKLQTFLQVRYERDGVITYRKHYFLLLGKTWQPIVVFLLLVGMVVVLFFFGGNIGDFLFRGSVITLLFILLIGVFLWWGYNYLDWSNDIYQLTPEQILDIERKPLGKEDKKTAPLDSILSLEHTREGIIQLLFNYGNVTINVGQTKFIFRGVLNPDQVHQDIADYIEARRRKKQSSATKRENKRMADWFATYKEQTEILEELEDESDFDILPE